MITIPTRLEDTLRKDRALHAWIEESVTTFELILRWSSLPFFPEYTDHGEQHLSDVLKTANALIRESSWALLSPRDVAALVLAVLLHDCAMHLDADAFLSIVNVNQTSVVHRGLDQKPWPHLWEEFLAEARRFDGKTLHNIFGTFDPVSVPPSDPQLFTERDRRLIGEFIRRHHPRLAHEIALHGMPGTSQIGLSNSISYDLRDISGLLARSHGHPLRTFLHYITDNYHLQEYQDTHIVFLMAVLRVADYLQVHSERAPKQHLKVARLRSPLSKQAWSNHAAITNITTQHDDPEAILIQARPNDVRTYLQLKELLRDLQHELDISWAVLGEVYGLRDKLRPLGLEIRRVKSNLDDEDTFGNSVTYLPCKASFESAGADLLKLLAEPLYGDDPTFGVRELIQNAVDACLELRNLPVSIKRSVEMEGRPDIRVSLSRDTEGQSSLIVDDRGIGMSPATLRNYFLRAGASYRKSTEWKKIHEDDAGHSRVLRSGRFGIGVLAAFILGDEIHVCTRHAHATRGLEFQATLETEPIELRHVDCSIGTTVTIKLHQSMAARLRTILGSVQRRNSYSFGALPSGLYLLESPSLDICLDGFTYTLERRWPSPHSRKLPPGWHHLAGTEFSEVHWTLREFANLACNGIAVADADAKKNVLGRYPAPKWFNDSTSLGLQTPTVSVFDPDGRLPLKLSRTELSSTPISFNQQLVEEICKDLCAYMLTEPWQAKFTNSTLPCNPHLCSYKGLGRKGAISYLCTEDGFTIPAPDIVPNLNMFRVIIAGLAESHVSLPPFEGAGTALMIQPASNIGMQTIDRWGKEHLAAAGKTIQPWGKVNGVRIYLHQMAWERWKSKVGRTIVRSTTIDCQYGDWVALEAGVCGQRSTTVESLATWAETNSDARDAFIKPAFAEYHLNSTRLPPFAQEPFFGRRMAEVLGGFVVPYSLAKRKRRYPRAFEQLANYIEAHLHDQQVEKQKLLRA
jgi:molecular chaperone HtpG